MKVTIELDEDEAVLAEYLAETYGITVEQAAYDALMDRIRELYASQSQPREKCIYSRTLEDSDDLFMDEDR